MHCYASLPYEFDKHETDVRIEFDAYPFEPKTPDYPGSEADVDITSVTEVLTGVELSPPEWVRLHLIECVWDYLEEREERARGEREGI